MPERFVKAIRFDEVRKGDVVCTRNDAPLHEVVEIRAGAGAIRLICKDGRAFEQEPEHFIGLIHRPPSRDEREMREEVLDKAHDLVNHPQLGSFDEKLEPLREVIEAYELSKPFKPEKQ